MCSSDILCPICGETHLRKINIAGRQQDNKDHENTVSSRLFYICYTCKMTFFEEDFLKNQNNRME